MFTITNIPVNRSLIKELKSPKIKMITLIVIFYILSRLLFFYIGVRFEKIGGAHTMHFISPEIIKDNLLQSVYYLHAQPPLFNLFVGTIIKLFPANNILVFHFLYIVFGLIFAISMFLLMTRLGISNTLSTILTIIFIVSPSCILYENILFYTYPVAALLCLSALLLHKFLSTVHLRYGIIFFILLSIIVLTRSLFHFLWFLFIVIILFANFRKYWKKIVLISCIPLIIIFLLYAKNMNLIGHFTGSSWFGMSFSKMITFMLPEDERILLMKQGKISELSLISPFSAIWFYHDYINVPKFKKTNIPVLDLDYYPGWGNNYNNAAFLSISKQYLNDSIYVLKSNPKAYLKGIVSSFFCYFYPTSDWFIDLSNNDNLNKINYLEKLYNNVLYGQFFNLYDPPTKEEYSKKKFSLYFYNIGIYLVIAFFVSVFYGIHLILRSFKMKSKNIPFLITILFLVVNIVYVTMVSNFFEIGENQRFRFNIDPFILTIVGLFLNNKLKRARSK